MYAVEEIRNLVNLIKLSPPDLMVVSMEGMKFPTWRLLLAMHSPLMANLLVQTLRPGDEGLLAVTLPLPFPSVSSMLASLGEGGNLDHLGEAAQLLGGNNKIPTKERNPKKFQGITEIQEGGSLVIVGNASQLSGTNNVIASTFVSAKVAVDDRNRDMLLKKESVQHSLVSTSFSQAQKIAAIEISPKECEIDLSEYSGDVTGSYSRNNVFDKSAKDIKNESANSGDEAEVDKADKEEPSMEETFIDIIDMKTDEDSKQSEGEPKTLWPDPGSVVPGLIFPDYDAMTTSLDEWSRANFSPLVKSSSGGIARGKPKPFHTFRCPHKKAKRRSSSLGIRRQRASVIEYVDCPFLINTKVNADGSCVVTSAVTKHSGHPISEEQFNKYRR